MTRRTYFVGVDMGGTNLRGACVSLVGEPLVEKAAPSPAGGRSEEVARNLADLVIGLELAARRRGLGGPRAVGVGVPGPLDVYSGTVLAAPHVAAWRGFPLRRRLEDRLSRRVTLENDANAWALGEFWKGAAVGRRNVVLVTLGTGVGGGVIVDGELLRGRSGMAGELGHVTVDPKGLRCDCGSAGCLEAYASASGLRRLVEQELAARGKRSLPFEYFDRAGDFSVRRLALAARAGDPLAVSVFRIAGRYLGIAIASFLNVFNPELVVIGGGVAGALPLMKTAMMTEVRSRSFEAIQKQCRIVRAALGPRGGVIGAARAAMNSMNSRRPVG